MTRAEATAEVFWTAFVHLPAEERRAFLERLIATPDLREDLLDAAVIEERRGEPTRPLKDVLAGGRSSDARSSR